MAEADPFADQEQAGSWEPGEEDIFDLSDVPENPEYEVMPSGIYNASIDEINYGQSQRSGNPMLTWILKVLVDDAGTERTLWYHTTLAGNGLSRTKRSLMALAGDEIDFSKFNPNKVGDVLVGRRCRVRVRIQMYEGQRRNSVSDVLPAEESFLT